MLFCCLLIFWQNQLFRKFLTGMPSDCQTVWIQIRPDILSGLIWVQTVSKGYQQATLRGTHIITLVTWSDGLDHVEWLRKEHGITRDQALIAILLTVFSPVCDLSSPFISENCMSVGSALTEVCLTVSPSGLLTVTVLSSLPRASRFSLLQAPQVILLVCFPRIGIFLEIYTRMLVGFRYRVCN